MHADDERLGQLVLLLRRRQGITQRILAALAGVPREDLIAIEAGRAGRVRLERIRAVFDQLGGRARLTAWYNGASADRLLDERHARILERALPVVERRRFAVASEVTFSDYGERGSLDLLALHSDTAHALVGEVKSAIGSLEETNRVLDVKARLAPKIVRERFGSTPASISRVLILPADRTVRRIIERHAATMTAIYPLRSREFRAWLRQPSGPISAIWFVSEVARSDPDSG
jgi:hypothetical protein